jgi:hypothetical protein
MKQKTFYMLAIVCCMSFFSAAKQNGTKCNMNCCKSTIKAKSINQSEQETGFNPSPLRLLIL